MTLGQRLKQLRNANNMTQKQLADKMNVTYQTISKWESDINEPNIAAMKELANLFSCSLDYLLDSEEETNTQKEKEEETNLPSPQEKDEEVKQENALVEKKNKEDVKQLLNEADCFEEKTYKKAADKKKKIPLYIGLTIGLIGSIASLVSFIVYRDQFPIAFIILMPLLIGYGLCSEIYCLLTSSFISEMFLSIASFSVKFPGLIFHFDLDGLAWLIAMKILFFILAILISVGAILFALFITTLISIFGFLPLLIHNWKQAN